VVSAGRISLLIWAKRGASEEIEYPLSPLYADDKGNGTSTTLVHDVTKVLRIREMTDLPIGADGGITAETAPLVVEVRAQVLVGGSAVYKGDPASEIRKIIEAGRRAARR
jgi:ribulose-phosphate 3-epimerase